MGGEGVVREAIRAVGMAGEALLASLPVHWPPHAELEESKTRAVHCLPPATSLLVNSVLIRIKACKLLAANPTGGSDHTILHTYTHPHTYASYTPEALVLYSFLGSAVGLWDLNFQQTPRWFSYSSVHVSVKKGKFHGRPGVGSNFVKIT